ncbi:E3 ISG15--protein ligase Herc6-like [Diadema antillarum]|uniref:E3 ISG15--protein ligase Herc6-like n=1 Tax=Diadema antillarum TaxID=105358 RepID=UPI003A89DF12
MAPKKASSGKEGHLKVIQLSTFRNERVTRAHSTLDRVAILVESGRVFSCRISDIADHDQYVEMVPRGFAGTVQETIRLVDLTGGKEHFVAMSTEGKIYSWGANSRQQLGRWEKKKNRNKGRTGMKGKFSHISEVEGLTEQKVIQIACGDYHCLALTRTGKLFTWGANDCSQLGLDSGSKEDVSQPTEVERLRGVPLSKIAAGGTHSVAVTTSGRALVWGNNEYGQLGLSKKKVSRKNIQ